VSSSGNPRDGFAGPPASPSISKHLVYEYIHGYFMSSMSGQLSNEGQAVSQEERLAEPKEPEEYRVLLLNDDFTTMEFVVSVLMTIFHKTLPEATRIMIDVHRKGRGIVGEYSYDIAATKINQVHSLARQMGFPLRCTMEKV